MGLREIQIHENKINELNVVIEIQKQNFEQLQTQYNKLQQDTENLKFLVESLINR